MKLLIALFLVAAAVAEPEADPYLFYQAQTPYYTSPYLYNAPRVYTPYAGAYSPFYRNRYLFKREAESAPESAPEAAPEAKSEADPYYVYQNSYLASPHTYGYRAIAPYTAAYPTAYSGVYTNPFYARRYLFKREAESEAEPEADPATVYTNGLFHTNLVNLNRGIHRQYATAPGALYNSVPYAYSGAYSGAYSSYIPAVTNYYTPYRHFGTRFVKRDAEPEADPLVYYNNPYLYNRALYNVYNRPYTTYAGYNYNYNYNPFGYYF